MTIQAQSFEYQFGPYDIASLHPAIRPVKSRLHLCVAFDSATAAVDAAPQAEPPAIDNSNIFAVPELMALIADRPDLAESTRVHRLPQRSRMANSRLVALRRKTLRTHVARTQEQAISALARSVENRRQIGNRLFSKPAEVDTRPSLPLRIAAQSINLSLILTVLPIGAAALTYNLLRGENMTFTARLSTLTGLALVAFGGDPNSLFTSLI